MKRFIGFGSIDQFRTVIKNISHEAQYVGYDEVTKEVQMNRLAKILLSVKYKIMQKIRHWIWKFKMGYWNRLKQSVI